MDFSGAYTGYIIAAYSIAAFILGGLWWISQRQENS